MVYKRYIKRGDKVYGPYIYHSRKKNGRVVSTYVGKDSCDKKKILSSVTFKKQEKKRFNFPLKKISVAIILLVFLVSLFFLFSHLYSTGKTISIENAVSNDSILQGILNFAIQQSELIPSDTKVIINSADSEYIYYLRELIPDTEQIQGDFYIREAGISGSGYGYSIDSVTRFPYVDFVLGVYGENQGDEGQTYTVPIEPDLEENLSEADQDDEEQGEDSENPNTGQRTLSGNVISNFFKFITEKITGKASLELVKEIQGQVRANETFTYELEEGQTAEIISSEQDIELSINNNQVIVITDYLGDELKIISIDLTELNIPSNPGDSLTITFVYNDVELFRDSKTITNISYVLVERTREVPIGFIIPDEIITEQEGNLTEQLIQGVAEINKPVNWTKRIRLREPVSNITVQIPVQAENIVATKIIDEIKDDITDELIEKEPVTRVTKDGKSEEFLALEIIVQDNATNYEIDYSTPGPQVSEEFELNFKSVTIYSDINYINVLTYTNITESALGSINLYWIVNGTRQVHAFKAYDLNNNSLIDYIAWITPHLSNQTFEIEISVINVQSYPTVGGNWTVEFTTSGTANLTISAVNGTTWSNENEDNDLKFLELRCGDEVLDYIWLSETDSVFIENYSCNSSGYETSKVLTSGDHHLEFRFGDEVAYAHNYAGGTTHITDTYINTSIINTGNITADYYFGDGSQLTGLLKDTGDTATGDYNFDSNTFVIDSTNDRVGIGVANPLAAFHVQADDDIRLQHKTAPSYYTNYGLTRIDAIGDNQPFSIELAGSTKLQILANGNIGIGTDSPTAGFMTYHATLYDPSLTWDSAAAVNFRNELSELIIGMTASSPWPYYIQARTSGSAGRSLVLNPLGGYVGIKTTSPDYDLDVAGTVRLASGDANNRVYLGRYSTEFPVSVLHFGNSASANNTSHLQIRDDLDNTIMTLQKDGAKVGIGTTTPSQKLDVNGSVNVTGNISVNAIDAGNSGVYMKTKVIEIGDWNMDTTESESVAHGLGNDYKKIRSVSAIIRTDSYGHSYFPLTYYVDELSGGVEGGIGDFDSTSILLKRKTGGYFDSTTFNSTSYNRGWVTITYTT